MVPKVSREPLDGVGCAENLDRSVRGSLCNLLQDEAGCLDQVDDVWREGNTILDKIARLVVVTG